jgi:hypothetical protein
MLQQESAYVARTFRNRLVCGAVLVPAEASMSRWGTTLSDLTPVMAGDGLIINPTFVYTMAATVNARPEHIWPWLVQMGYQGGGLYSYD